MKTSLAFLVLAFSVVCHAQVQRWQLEIPGPFDTLTNSVVYPDGAGGGAILIGPRGGTYTRVIWFNSRGTILLSNIDGRSLNVVRVRPGVLDLQTAGTAGFEELPVVIVRHFVAESGRVIEPRDLQLAPPGSGNEGIEHIASVPTMQPDRRGFFTVQSGATNLFVRRVTF